MADEERRSSTDGKRDGGDTEENGQAAKRPKIAVTLGNPAAKPIGLMKPIAIKLGGGAAAGSKPPAKPGAVQAASLFGAGESDSEEEEMPPEARMRMRNVGKDTPTSAGPNSFGKTGQGFSDTKRTWEKKAKELAAKEGVELASIPKDKDKPKDPHKLVEELAGKAKADDE